MIIKSRFKEYRVTLCEDLSRVREAVGELTNAYVVVDEQVYRLYRDTLFQDMDMDRILLVQALEEKKTIDTVLEICERMTGIPAKRNAHLISVGGGIIQDITGMAANILYRGIRWTFVPTTLLAACDSCIGGKTSLNYKGFKNLLGTFYPPDDIYICASFFDTLSERDFESGLGEVVKFNVLAGEEGLEKIENHMDGLLKRERGILNDCIRDSLNFKRRYIEEDEFDRGIRVHLNFAHTFGHAIESVSGYAVPHGTAVAMGTIMADYVSCRRGLLHEEICRRIEEVLKRIIHVDSKLTGADMEGYLSALRKDKKQVDDRLTAVIMDEKMQLQIIHDLQREEIEAALKHLSETIG